jgi:hypothetical protein
MNLYEVEYGIMGGRQVADRTTVEADYFEKSFFSVVFLLDRGEHKQDERIAMFEGVKSVRLIEADETIEKKEESDG